MYALSEWWQPKISKSTVIWEDVTAQLFYFFCPTRCSNLKQFPEITLEFWQPLRSTSFELDFVYHIPKVPYFPFPKAKDPNFCKYLRQQYFKKHGRLARKSHYFWSYILFWWTSKRVSQFLKPGNGESLGNTGVLLMVARHDNFLMNCNLWKAATQKAWVSTRKH